MRTVLTLTRCSAAVVITVLAMAASADEFEANHTIVSTASNGMGLNTITLEMTIINHSPSDLNAVKLQLMPEPKVRIIGTPQLEVAHLGAGGSTTVHWSLISPLPAEVVAGSRPLRFSGEALDVSGSQVPVHLTSIPLH